MGGNGGHFRVTLSIRREPNAGPVYCKMETSTRFRQLKTVKLSAEATYRLDISFKPPQVLQCVTTSPQCFASFVPRARPPPPARRSVPRDEAQRCAFLASRICRGRKRAAVLDASWEQFF